MTEATLFDADSFLSTQVEGSMSTKSEPVPEGDYRSVITEVEKPRLVQPGVGQDFKPFVNMNVTHKIDDPALAEKLGRKEVLVRQQLAIELGTDGKPSREKGTNIGLGALREALGQNDPSKPWNPLMLKGAGPLMIKVKHRRDKKDESVIYAEVARTAKAA